MAVHTKVGQVDVKRVTAAQLEDRLRGFERQYGMSSEQFYERAGGGLLEESDAFADWLGYYEAYLRLRR